jgi:GDPmannose 4,6-dehydratase
MTFAELGVEIEFQGEGVDEKGVIKSVDTEMLNSLVQKYTTRFSQTVDISLLKPGKVVVEVSPKYFRPTEVDLLIGNATKAKNELGWEAETKLAKLVKIMVNADFNAALNRV